MSDDARAPHPAAAPRRPGRPGLLRRQAGSLPPAAAAVHTASAPAAADREVLVSVVMPCLNEVGSVGVCVAKAVEGLARAGLNGEVVVADNGSTDGSVAAATAAGARVVYEPRRGYGSAYLAGFAAARGRYIVMGDSDDSYDFTRLGDLVEPLVAGEADYVLGSRFAGKIQPGAMPWTHQHIGNPILTGLLNLLFGLSSSDAHSGMRAFTRDAYQRMQLRCEGMELASELVVAAAWARLRVREVPITYHPRIGSSKLHGLRDGWRHLRFMLLLAPRFLFVLPGLLLLLAGLGGQAALLVAETGPSSSHGATPSALLFALSAVVGFQAISLGIYADAYNASQGWGMRLGRPTSRALRAFTLERGLVGGALLLAAGLAVEIGVLADGSADGRLAVLALTLMAVGTQTLFGSFLLHLLRGGGAARRPAGPAVTTVTTNSTSPAVTAEHATAAAPAAAARPETFAGERAVAAVLDPAALGDPAAEPV